MKKVTIVCVAIAVVFALLFLYIMFGMNSRVTQDISYYQALSGETEGKDALWIFPWGDYVRCPYALPQLGELGAYQQYRFVHTAERVSIFYQHAYVLIMEYDGQEYETQKRAMEDKYVYCTPESQGFADGIMTECSYTMDDFTIRAVEGGEYPHEMLFIGCSDTRQEIAIIYYYDQDLDYVDVPLGKFIEANTGWEKVV